MLLFAHLLPPPRCALAGDAAVGKSSSVERFVKNEFFAFQQPTIVRRQPHSHLTQVHTVRKTGRESAHRCGVTAPAPPALGSAHPTALHPQGAAFLTQTVALDDYIVKFEIWDTAGQVSDIRAHLPTVTL